MSAEESPSGMPRSKSLPLLRDAVADNKDMRRSFSQIIGFHGNAAHTLQIQGYFKFPGRFGR